MVASVKSSGWLRRMRGSRKTPPIERENMNSKKVKLSSGHEVVVYVPPMGKLHSIALARYPIPKVPIIEEKTATGDTIRMAVENDPDYLAKVDEMEEKRRQAVDELNILFALQLEKTPDDFDVMVYSEEIQYINPDWAPREGKVGRKLDWIEFDLLGAFQDSMLVQNTLNELIGIDMEVVEQIAASFPGQVEG